MNKININKIGDTIFINCIKKNKVYSTFRFSEIDLITREDSKRLFKALLKHFNDYELLIFMDTYKYLRGIDIL